MSQVNRQPKAGSENARAVEQLLRTVRQDLTNLHQELMTQLEQDISQLKSEKSRLIAEIEKLRTYQQALQARQEVVLSQQQLAQQQLWAKQLAQILANHLQGVILQRLNQIAANQQAAAALAGTGMPATAAGLNPDNAQQLLTSLNSALTTTIQSVQQELTNYQSSLSQQIGRMQSLEQQGETILQALVTRLRENLHQAQALAPAPTTTSVPPSNGAPGPAVSDSTSLQAAQRLADPPMAAPIPIELPAAPLPLPIKPRPEISQFQLGILLVMLSTFALSLHNVVVRVIGKESVVLGLFQVGGFLHLGFGNSLLTLWLRMLVVLPLMLPVSMVLYPPVWEDIKRFIKARDHRPLYNVVASGCFLFLSQVLIYIAIGQIGAGPAVTILFMYPIVTVPLAWLLFRDRPTRLRWIVMGLISLGVILAAPPGGHLSGGGALTAAAAGVAFAFYLIFMQLGFKKLHPVPVSLIQFGTIFVLSSLLLILPVDLGVQVDKPGGFIVGGLVLGALTLIGYLANNFGVRLMGAARASIVASSGPVMTALFAFLLINNPLLPLQWLGVLLVTLGVALLSFERFKGHSNPTKPPYANGRKPVPSTRS
jgi:drug/metabolite transporter (DMT)-like permease